MSIYLWNKTIVYSDMQWPCPDWFHVPLKSEMSSLVDIITSTFSLWKNGMINYLKMPMAWLRAYNNWGVWNQWSQAYYWTSSWWGEGKAWYMGYAAAYNPVSIGDNRTWDACSIRAFKNSPVIPDSSWTTLYDWSSVAIWAWIFHNVSHWLISISWDGSTWYTIQDKNLWATIVWDWSRQQSSCWWYFQRWNNYMFPFSWDITTANGMVDAGTYWPWNYYDSSTFIIQKTRPRRWDSSDNKNLWWWETQWTSTVTVPAEIKNLYIWANEAKEVYVGSNKVRPSIPSNYSLDFLVVWWWWGWGWSIGNGECIQWWGWWGWAVIECSNYLILWGSINVTIWQWWCGWYNWVPCNWWDTCFYDIIAPWWWAWWSPWWDGNNWHDWASWWWGASNGKYKWVWWCWICNCLYWSNWNCTPGNSSCWGWWWWGAWWNKSHWTNNWQIDWDEWIYSSISWTCVWYWWWWGWGKKYSPAWCWKAWWWNWGWGAWTPNTWWGWWWSGYWGWTWWSWVVIVRYPTNWNYWIKSSTWWTCCYICNWYCVHVFNEDWTFEAKW